MRDVRPEQQLLSKQRRPATNLLPHLGHPVQHPVNQHRPPPLPRHNPHSTRDTSHLTRSKPAAATARPLISRTQAKAL
jgi:hypothetical protein